jgi:uncharacterized protein
VNPPAGDRRLGHSSSDAVFAAPVGEWRRVSPRLATARRLPVSGLTAVLALACVLAAVALDSTWPLVGLPVLAAFLAWLWWVVGRQVGAVGWVEREDDLAVTQGLMWRRLVVVPYGRMQFVDVTAGPLERWLGIASVQLHTATPATSAAIPGLTPAEATALRDRLSALGEARAAGL